MPAPHEETSAAALRAIDDAAAAWVSRCDRGLKPAEQDEFFQWLAADPRHGERLARHQRGWAELANLAQWRPEHGAEPNADLLAPPRQPRSSPGILWWLVPATLAVAASLAFVFTSHHEPAPPRTHAITRV